MNIQIQKTKEVVKGLLLTMLCVGLSIVQIQSLQAKNHEQIKLVDAQAEEDLEQYFDDIASAWKGHRKFADWLIRHMKPKQVVDLGVDFGYSTFVFAKAAREIGAGRITGVDLFLGDEQTGDRDTHQIVLGLVDQFQFDNIEIIKAEFGELASRWTRKIDILHIDGLHTYDAVSSDFNNWAKFVRKSGVVLFHDINVPLPGYEVVEFFRELKGGYKLYFMHSFGLGIYTKDKNLYKAIKKAFPGVFDDRTKPL